MQNSFNLRAAPESNSRFGSESGKKVHVIPITVEGRDLPVAQRSNTPVKDLQQQEHPQQSAASQTAELGPSHVQQNSQHNNEPQRQRHSSQTQDQVPICHAQQSQPQQSQPQQRTTFVDSELRNSTNQPNGRVINIPIKVERENSPEPSIARPRLGNYSDSHIPHFAGEGIHPKSSTPGQKQSNTSRPQSASYSDLPFKQHSNAHAFSNSAGNSKLFSQPSEGRQETKSQNSSNGSSPKPEPSELERIQTIVDEVKRLESEVDSFQGSTQDKQYRYLDEYLTRNLIKLDQIETNGNQEIRQARKNAISLIESIISKLESIGKALVKRENVDNEAKEMEVTSSNTDNQSKAMNETSQNEESMETKATVEQNDQESMNVDPADSTTEQQHQESADSLQDRQQ